jgi:hypothetical protein
MSPLHIAAPDYRLQGIFMSTKCHKSNALLQVLIAVNAIKTCPNCHLGLECPEFAFFRKKFIRYSSTWETSICRFNGECLET